MSIKQILLVMSGVLLKDLQKGQRMDAEIAGEAAEMVGRRFRGRN